GPVIYATFVVIAVFLPELFSSSVEGHFVGALALAFILAVLASLLVALTATPALCAILLHARDARETPRWLDSLKRLQGRMLTAADRGFAAVIAVLALFFAGSLALLPFLGGTLMPDFKEGHFVMQVATSIPGTSLEEMLALGQRIEADVLRLPYVQT